MIILFRKEAGFPVDTPLHDVLRYHGEFYEWAAWWLSHGKIFEAGPFSYCTDKVRGGFAAF